MQKPTMKTRLVCVVSMPLALESQLEVRMKEGQAKVASPLYHIMETRRVDSD